MWDQENILFYRDLYIFIFPGPPFAPPTTSPITHPSTTCLTGTSPHLLLLKRSFTSLSLSSTCSFPKTKKGALSQWRYEISSLTLPLSQKPYWCWPTLPQAFPPVSLAWDGIHGGHQAIIIVGTPPCHFHLPACEELYRLHGWHCWGPPHHCEKEAGWSPIQVSSIQHVSNHGILCWAAWALCCCAVEGDPPRGCPWMPRCGWARFNSTIYMISIPHFAMIQIGLHDIHRMMQTQHGLAQNIISSW